MVRVAVIGAGAAGITAVKTCLEYGYDVVCFEKSDNLGGVWYFKPGECEGQGSVMRSTVMNTSKEMVAFSDFIPPQEYGIYMHNRHTLSYLRSYAEHFGVVSRVRFEHAVQLVTRADDYDATGQWMVTVKDLKSGRMSTETFDGVMLCSGHHSEPFEPPFPGLRDGTFQGRVLHSHSYKDATGFEDKTVLVVGSGNSGVDVSVETSRVAKKVYLVTRRGTWLWHRILDGGVPTDMALNSHVVDKILKIAPRIFQAHMERKFLSRCDLEKFGLMPAHHLLQGYPSITDELPNRIAAGLVTVKPNVEAFIGPKSCRFVDGTVVDNIDVVVLCTGYKFGFPYLEPGVISKTSDNWFQAYKHMYSPILSRPETLAFIGLIEPIAAFFPIDEMQSRVFCEYLQRKNGRVLPDKDQMFKDVQAKAEENKNLFLDTFRTSVQMQYVPYMTELATMIDAQPASPLTYLLKGDPKLAWALAFGPCLSYEFRLRGPHAWEGARDAILGVGDRMTKTTKVRLPPPHACGKERKPGFGCLLSDYQSHIIGLFVIFAAVIVAVMFAF